MRGWRWRRGIVAAAAALCAGAPSGDARAEKCPNMLILLDRSTSMAGAKWTAALEAISGFTRGREEVMRFGLQVFPAPGDACGPGLQVAGCEFFQATAIDLELSRLSPGGLTPTADALIAAASTADVQDRTRRRFVILVTDGEPTCPDLNDIPRNHLQALAAVQELALSGVKTFVVGFGQDVSQERLDQLAIAGGTARTGAACDDPLNPGSRVPCRYFEASDRASLASAFDEIATIASGELLGAACDDSCYAIGACPAGEKCVKAVRSYGTRLVNLGTCVPDPCSGVACGADGFCREGRCIASCLSPCPPSQVCRDGACVSDPCGDPAACSCAISCPRFLTCVAGVCADDPCRSIVCPAAAPYCNQGSCFAAAPPAPEPLKPPPDAGPTRQLPEKTGCACGGDSAALVGGALGAGLFLDRARRRRAR
ncbi:MAG: VWA domain-containing protein [Deltaproteobacteria bacterium]|nr:VWA domain-containing protein [Deltaproteobacteria bacterium]